jgi:hypothetical protein
MTFRTDGAYGSGGRAGRTSSVMAVLEPPTPRFSVKAQGEKIWPWMSWANRVSALASMWKRDSLQA